MDARAAELVKLRLFAGLTLDEAAAALELFAAQPGAIGLSHGPGFSSNSLGPMPLEDSLSASAARTEHCHVGEPFRREQRSPPLEVESSWNCKDPT